MPLTQHSQTAQHREKALHVGSGEKSQHGRFPLSPDLISHRWQSTHSSGGRFWKQNLTRGNKERLKRRDQQEEAVGRAPGGGHAFNSPMQRKGPEQSCRRSGHLPPRVPCGFHGNYRLRWVNPPGKGGKSLRKSFHPLIIQKCPWLPSEGVCVPSPSFGFPAGDWAGFIKTFSSRIAPG